MMSMNVLCFDHPAAYPWTMAWTMASLSAVLQGLANWTMASLSAVLQGTDQLPHVQHNANRHFTVPCTHCLQVTRKKYQ